MSNKTLSCKLFFMYLFLFLCLHISIVMYCQAVLTDVCLMQFLSLCYEYNEYTRHNNIQETTKKQPTEGCFIHGKLANISLYVEIISCFFTTSALWFYWCRARRVLLHWGSLQIKTLVP